MPLFRDGARVNVFCETLIDFWKSNVVALAERNWEVTMKRIGIRSMQFHWNVDATPQEMEKYWWVHIVGKLGMTM